MKTIYLLLVSVVSLFAFSCATQERQVLKPQGSDASTIPWNIPGANEGQGGFGGGLSR